LTTNKNKNVGIQFNYVQNDAKFEAQPSPIFRPLSMKIVFHVHKLDFYFNGKKDLC
jgi:hypothetical protein